MEHLNHSEAYALQCLGKSRLKNGTQDANFCSFIINRFSRTQSLQSDRSFAKHTEMLNIQMHDNELRAFFWSPRLPPTLSLTSKLLQMMLSARTELLSDLEGDQLFYIQACVIDIEATSKVPIISFAAEMIEHYPNTCEQKKVESLVRELRDQSIV